MHNYEWDILPIFVLSNINIRTMTDKLDWNEGAMELMEYIGLVEVILLSDFDDYRYPFNVSFVEATKEEVEKANASCVPLTATLCMKIFKERYDSNKIIPKSTYKEYFNNKTIQNLINDLELDADKFWLLVLFIYDYCKNLFYDGVTMKQTPFEQLTELCTAINKSEDVLMTLTFKAGKQKIIVDSPIAIKAIAEMIANYQKEADEDYYKNLHKRDKANESIMLKESPFVAFFANIFLYFFNTQPQIKAKRKKGAKHSIKETDLVCQLIYFTKISKSKCWTVLENETLKAYLKQYRSYEYPNNVNSIYPDFSI